MDQFHAAVIPEIDIWRCVRIILEPETWDAWLKGDPEAAAALMKPMHEGVLISRLAGNVKNNGPELLEAAVTCT